MLTINVETAHRFILGKQGLWPGRRWRGSEGTEQAMHAMEYLQKETVAPAHLLCESDEAEADRFLIKKDVSFSGLSRPSRVAESFRGYGENESSIFGTPL